MHFASIPNYRCLVAGFVATILVVAPASADPVRLARIELRLMHVGEDQHTTLLEQIYEELCQLVTFRIDGVAYPPATLELCRSEEQDTAFYHPCGLRLDRTSTSARILVPRGAKLELGATHPGAKRLRERTNDWVVVLHDDDALEGKHVPVGATYWEADGRLEVDHLEPRHRYLQVIVADPSRVWREKLTWILDRGSLGRPMASDDPIE